MFDSTLGPIEKPMLANFLLAATDVPGVVSTPICTVWLIVLRSATAGLLPRRNDSSWSFSIRVHRTTSCAAGYNPSPLHGLSRLAEYPSPGMVFQSPRLRRPYRW